MNAPDPVEGPQGNPAALCLAIFLLVTGGLVTAGTVAAAETGADGCRRLQLSPQPAWTPGGAWAGDDLVLVDVGNRRLVRYAVDGDIARARPVPANERGPTYSHPVFLQATADGGFLLLDRVDHLVWLDADLRPVDELSLPGGLDAPDLRVLGMREVGVLGDGVIGMMYHIDNTGEHWKGWGAVEFTTGTVRRLGERNSDATVGRLDGLTHPLVAIAGGTAYALQHGTEPYLLRLGETPQRLDSFPIGPWRLANLPGSGGREDTVASFRRLEITPMPLALYGHGAHVYLLTRRPAVDGSRWQLHQIDPEEDRVVQSHELPTRANHVTLVPGDRYWALVEKGRVTAPGTQTIESLILLPSAAIETPPVDSQNPLRRDVCNPS